MSVEKQIVIVISTSHLPGEKALEEADILHAQYEYGAFVYMDPEYADAPAWYQAIVRWAKAQHVDWVRFDCDARTVDGLDVFQQAWI